MEGSNLSCSTPVILHLNGNLEASEVDNNQCDTAVSGNMELQPLATRITVLQPTDQSAKVVAAVTATFTA